MGGKPNNKDVKQQRHVKFKSDKAIAAAVKKKVHERLKAVEQVKAQGDEAEAYIMSIFQKMTGNKATIAATVNLPRQLPHPHGGGRAGRKRGRSVSPSKAPKSVEGEAQSKRRHGLQGHRQPPNSDHVIIALLGKIKGEHHDLAHLVPCVPKTGSGALCVVDK
jgi:hypothetical protein